MNLKMTAKEFAIEAHKGQVRKSDPEKPMIVHPINVGDILEEYLCDENVIAAGFLHDVIENTRYTKEDIEEKFGTDIGSLVVGASEPDKSLSWEDRKKHTIERIKGLDLRHKSIICADKISNLEDLKILSGIKGEYNFSVFKRGFNSQKWYYIGVYKSLIENEDESLLMFLKLKELIDHVFNNITNDDYIKKIIFEKKSDEYKELLKIHYKKEEIFKLIKVLSNKFPYIIEFTGSPRTGKTSLINNLNDFFKKQGFAIEVLEEFTTSKKYKEEIFPLLKDKYKNIVTTEIPKYALNQLEEAINRNPDIIIVDRSLFDRLIWVDRLFLKEGMTNEEYNDYKSIYIPLIKKKINIIISTYVDGLTTLKRDYGANLSLEKRNFLNEANVNEFNKSLLNMKKLSKKENIDFYLFDTTNKNQRLVSFEIVNTILDDMRTEFINRANNEFK